MHENTLGDVSKIKKKSHFRPEDNQGADEVWADRK